MEEIPLRFEGKTAHLQATGPAGGRAVLFVHPFPLHSGCWEEMMQACAGAGLRVAAVDAPGFGGTPARGKPLAMDDLARLLASGLDALGAPRASLVGCSMGGYAIFAFARLFPERLERVGLLCTKASADTPAAREKREAQAQAALTHGAAAVTAEILPQQLAPGAAPALLARLRTFAAEATPQGIADALRGMALRPDSLPDLPRWRYPALVLEGENDRIVPSEESAAMARAIPGATHRVVKGAGHLAFLEKPEETAAALIARLTIPLSVSSL